MANFDTARAALETSQNSAGSAMAEHAKWSESLQARLNKLKATWQSLSQTFLKSDFLKGGIDLISGLVNVLDGIIDKVGLVPTLLGGFASGKILKNLLSYGAGITSIADAIDILKMSFPGLSKAATSLIGILSKVKVAFTNAFLLSGGGGAGLFAGLISGVKTLIGMLNPVTAIITGIAVALSLVGYTAYKQKKSVAELSEKVDEATTKYREQRKELIKNKSSFKSLAERYTELSKGVGSQGENISLTTDEYLEYQDVVNSIAEQVPSLVKGYNSQGNAILQYTDNIRQLTDAYEDLIKAQNNELLRYGKDGIGIEDIEKDFKNEMKKFDGKNGGLKNEIASDSIKRLEEALNGKYSKSKIEELFDDGASVVDVVDALKERGLAKDVHWYSDYDAYWDAIADAINNDPKTVREIINDFKSNVNAASDEIKEAAQAALSNAIDFSDSSHADMSDVLKNIARQTLNGLNSEEYQKILDSGKTVEEYVDGMLDSFKKLEENGENGKIKELEASFNLKTKFNNGEISYGEYADGIERAAGLIEGLDLDDNVKSQINIALDTKKVTDDYNALEKRLTEEYELEMGTEEAQKKAEEFLHDMTASKYTALTDLKIDGEIELGEFKSIEALDEYLDKQAKIKEAMSFTIAMDVETESLSALNTAMAESVSGAGLSSEAITALKGRYADLASEGYNLSSMFEETSNGIHLNRKAVSELEEAYASDKLKETDKHLEVLKNRYDELTKEIKNCSNASERAGLYSEQRDIVNKINDLATMASQYKGLTSAYNQWVSAEEAGSERDMYENIISGFETIKDEMARGWYDDGTIEFLELLTGKTDLAGKSASELKEIYDSLDKKIKNTSYTVKDFFTVDKDGNSTSKGVYNFLDAVGQLKEEAFGGKDVVKRDGKGNVIGFDFELAGGDEVIAEALGISEELVQIMVRAADDAGFVVNLEGAYTQLANLKTEAEAARDALISLRNNGLDKGKLKGVDLNFDFDATGDNLVKEQERAVKLLDKFKKDGKIDLSIKGAQNALDIAEYLTIKLDDLTEPKIMQIDTSEVEENLQDPIEKMQEIVKLSKEKNLISLTGDTKEIKKVQGEIDKVAKDLKDLKPEIKAKVGIDDKWDAKTIADKIAKGEIEIPAELKLDVQMSDDLKDMRLMMMNQLGLATDEEVKLKIGYDIDDSTVDEIIKDGKAEVVLEFIESNEDWFKSLSKEKQEVVVEYVSKGKDFDALTKEEQEVLVKLVGDDSELKSWTPEEKEAMVKYIVDGGDVEDWTPEEKQAFAKYLVDGGNVEGWTPEAKDAFVKYLVDGGDPDSFDPDDKESWVIYKKDSSEPDGYTPDDEEATVEYNKDSSAVDSYDPPNLFRTVFYTIVESVASAGKKAVERRFGVGGANGTANVNGTAFANGTIGKLGRAFKRGDWSTSDSGTALGGELGRETIVRDGHFFTIGDNGAEFFQYKKGDIIFNHKQTEELFKNGKVTSGGGRGRAFSSGTGGGAWSSLNKYNNKTIVVAYTDSGTKNQKGKVGEELENNTKKVLKNGSGSAGYGGYVPNSNDSSGSGGGSGGGGDSGGGGYNLDGELFDWIETLINKIERAIDQFDKKFTNVFDSWGNRADNLAGERSEIDHEIRVQQKGYDRYMKEANSIGLSQFYIDKIQKGEIDLSNIGDEDLQKQISKYQELWDKAQACEDAVIDLNIAMSETYQEEFDFVIAHFDGLLSVIEHEKSTIEEYINQSEAQGWMTSSKYYDALIKNEQETIDTLKSERDDLTAVLANGLENGTIVNGSEAHYNMIKEIDAITLSIQESETAMLEWNQSAQQLKWEQFDLLQEKISAITDETSFLIDLMSNDKLHDDNGKLTDEGKATMGLHGVAYNVNMTQADQVGAEIARLEKEMAEDPLDLELQERYREMVALQQDYILAAEDEKEAIRDLVEEGIELELDALQERIDKYNEAMESQRDLYEYQKKVKEQTEEIADLQKLMSAYEGDDSEEAKAKIQEWKVSLEEAEANLEETEYDKYITDQQKMLDDLYLEYETILNTRLDNIDMLLTNMIDEINADATNISETISGKVGEVGVSLSESMKEIWSGESDGAKSVITSYGENFSKAQTATNTALGSIGKDISNMLTNVDRIANKNNETAGGSSAAGDSIVGVTGTGGYDSPAEKREENKGKPKKGDKVRFDSGSYYLDSYGSSPIGSKHRGEYVYITYTNERSSATHPYHISIKKEAGEDSDLGWVKLNQLSGYATGKEKFFDDETAWTQENALKEFIVRPSDGAILTPIAKGDSVLNAQASRNIWDMANSPTDFIRDNLGINATSVPNNQCVHNNYTQHLENVVFSMPNVKNYDEMLSAMQRDRSFEKLVLSMTIDRATGRSSLAKNKVIK